jgi:uncharacterized protein
MSGPHFRMVIPAWIAVMALLSGSFSPVKAGLRAVYGNSLCEAAAKGDLPRVQALLGDGIAVDARNTEGQTALMHAAAKNHAALVDFLLERGADPNALSESKVGTHALTWAIESKNPQIVESFLKKGATINVQGKTGLSPLCKAIEAGSFPIFTLLASRGADLRLPGVEYHTQAKDKSRMLSPLLAAAHYGAQDAVAFLLEKGVDPNTADAYGDSALMFAARAGRSKVADLLIQKGADVNHQGIDGHTALIYASFNGFIVIVNSLLAAGADVTLRAVDREEGKVTSTYTAESLARQEGHPEIAAILRQSKAKK